MAAAALPAHAHVVFVFVFAHVVFVFRLPLPLRAQQMIPRVHRHGTYSNEEGGQCCTAALQLGYYYDELTTVDDDDETRPLPLTAESAACRASFLGQLLRSGLLRLAAGPHPAVQCRPQKGMHAFSRSSG